MEVELPSMDSIGNHHGWKRCLSSVRHRLKGTAIIRLEAGQSEHGNTGELTNSNVRNGSIVPAQCWIIECPLLGR